MTTQTYALGLGAFIKSEGVGHISRDPITIVSGAGALKSGTVLGKVTASGKYKAYDNEADDGSQTAAAILLEDADATAADVNTVGIMRLAEVYGSRLVWGAAVTTEGEKTAAIADLAALQVIVR